MHFFDFHKKMFFPQRNAKEKENFIKKMKKTKRKIAEGLDKEKCKEYNIMWRIAGLNAII